MSNELFHVEVYIEKDKEWQLVRPSGGGLPYLFTREQAESHVRVYSIRHPGKYRLKPTGRVIEHGND
jgi:hypothetical protein